MGSHSGTCVPGRKVIYFDHCIQEISFPISGQMSGWNKKHAFRVSHFYIDTKLFIFFLKEPPRMLQNFKNPCWAESSNTTSILRCFPYFYVAGFPKCGTTDLYSEIIKHPMIAKADIKGSHWWSRQRFKNNGRYTLNSVIYCRGLPLGMIWLLVKHCLLSC